MAATKKDGGLGAFGRAATGLLNMGVAGVAAVGAAALHSWPILAVGGVTYGALVAWDFVRKGGQGAQAAAEPAKLRRAEDYGDAQTRASVGAMAHAKAEIDRVLEETPEEVRGNLAGAVVSVEALLERAATLAERADDLSGYLSTKDPRRVETEITSLKQRVAQTTDEEARGQYGAALASREEHLKALGDLRDARERVIASLLSIASSLDGLPAKIVHMRALDASAMDKLGGDVNEELERVNDEMKAFEETLRALGGADGARKKRETTG